jgi:alkanesulfonate monooxygenase SsuD/methylene tetrahydromethanopterin reductase-like flavin-dependent oxidoreductase (luciferase family)
VLSGGRFRLGIGVGWNKVEYVALNQDFHMRGRRVDEQIEVLRQLWTEPLVDFAGEFHTIPDAGINPLPVQRPIPLWFGGHADAVLRRLARAGDGWLPNYRDPVALQPELEKLAGYVAEQGRSMREIGIEPRLHLARSTPDSWGPLVESWRAIGATHLSVNTMGCGFETPDAHLDALRRFAVAVGISG